MTIEISGRANNPTPIKTPPKPHSAESEKKLAATASAEKDDSVALTSATQEIKKALGASSAAPVDTDRVNSIKKALADGSYSINAEKVAQKLIQFEQLIPQENSAEP
ncbi:MAG: flagellar biosynthesis anti-sigma factor FlgM [Methylobacter sp.]|nr:flagellar biosynthesis anti-sigma factor FlgM [Methylobacter sp.]MDP2097096.1 flagellar biosynthesis anti-sigma factor FlgM [Methylobacter sp.]MDP2428034.1 flagellar biosynthesis anti-sigma factor FlgM [Methylobacter sp.]MDP3055930.1 flagellar biosynthesis anti-sigma factor FlgM [Methylobacter sp.]MDP3363088.1 flagellar biosynthesis anti-sigma factor FlgM [Methylobacter sp.]